MNYQIRCPSPSCGKKLSIPENLVGRKVRCRACSQVMMAEPHLLKPSENQPAVEPPRATVPHIKPVAETTRSTRSVQPDQKKKTISQASPSHVKANLTAGPSAVRESAPQHKPEKAETVLPSATHETPPEKKQPAPVVSQPSAVAVASIAVEPSIIDGVAPIVVRSEQADQLGRYLLRERLGAGAFGSVYRAYDPQLDRDVAVKIPHEAVIQNPKRVERFFREARAAAGLRHPNVVPVFDSGKVGDKYFIASAFITGKPLEEFVEPGGIEFRKAAEFIRKIAEGLAYAHSQGVVHRDIKPANIMVDEKDQPLIADFGLASRQEDESRLTSDGTVMGTPSYMAPEQAAGSQGEAHPAADQYSLSVVLYELLTGKTLFEGPPAIVMHNQIHTAPEAPGKLRSGLPRDLETICLKGLSKSPADRFANCQVLADDLRRWLDGEPITARRLGPVERATRWVKKEPKLAAALGTILAALVVIGILLTVRNTVLVHDLHTVTIEKEKFQEQAAAEAAAAELARDSQYLAQLSSADAKSKLGDATGVHQIANLVPADRAASEWGFVRMRADHAPDYRRRFRQLPPSTMNPNPLVFAGSFAVRFPSGQKTLLGMVTTPPTRQWDPAKPFTRWNLTTGMHEPLPVPPGLPMGLSLEQISTNANGTRIAFAKMNGGTPGELSPLYGDADPSEMPPQMMPMPAQPVPVPSPSDSSKPSTTGMPRTREQYVSTRAVQEPAPLPSAPNTQATPSPTAPQAADPASAPAVAGPLSMDIVVLDVSPPKEIRTIHIEGTLPTVALSPDGKWVAVAYAVAGQPHRLGVWNVETGERVVALDHDLALVPFQGVVLAFSPDSTAIAATTAFEAGEIHGWSIPDGKEILSLTKDIGLVSELAFSPDGSRIAAVGGQEIVRYEQPQIFNTSFELAQKTKKCCVTVCKLETREALIRQLDENGYECTAKHQWTVSVPVMEIRDISVTLLQSYFGSLPGPWIARSPRLQHRPINESYTVYKDVVETYEVIEKIPGTRIVDGKEEPCECEVAKPVMVTKKVPEMRTRTKMVSVQAIDMDLVRIWERADGKLTFRVEEPELVTAIDWRPDGKRLAGATIGLVSTTSCIQPTVDCTQPPAKSLLVKIWDSRTEQLMMSLDDPEINRATALAFNSEGLQLAVGLEKTGDVICWSSASEQLLANHTGLPGPMNELVFSPDGQTLAGFCNRDWSAWMWDAEDHSKRKIIKGAQVTYGIGFGVGQEFLTGLGKRPDSSVQSWARPGVGVWNRELGEPYAEKMPNGFTPSADGKRVLVGGSDGAGNPAVQIRDARSGEVIATLAEGTPQGFWLISRDGSRVACFNATQGNRVYQLHVWDGASGKKLYTRGGTSFFGAFHYNAENSTSPVSLVMIQIEPTPAIFTLDANDGTPLASCSIPADVAPNIGEILPVGKNRAILVDRNLNWVKVWDTQNAVELVNRSIPQNTAQQGAFAVSPNRKFLATVSIREISSVPGAPPAGPSQEPMEPALFHDLAVEVTEIETGKTLISMVPPGNAQIEALAFSSDSTRLAVGGAKQDSEGLLEVFDLASTFPTALYSGFVGQVNSLAFSPDGMKLASSVCDGTLKVWRAPPPGSPMIMIDCDAFGPIHPTAAPAQSAPMMPPPAYGSHSASVLSPSPVPQFGGQVLNAEPPTAADSPAPAKKTAMQPPKLLAWDKFEATTSGDFIEPQSPSIVFISADGTEINPLPIENLSPVQVTHPFSRQSHATMKFGGFTNDRAGVLKLALRSVKDDSATGGGAKIAIRIGGQLYNEVVIKSDEPTLLDVPFDHQDVVMEHLATGWDDEYLFLQFKIEERQ